MKTKIKLNPMSIHDFCILVNDFHQLSRKPINPMTTFDQGMILLYEDLIAYHLEIDATYEYIYSEKEHTLMIQIDNIGKKQPQRFVDYLISHRHIDKNELFYVSYKPFKILESEMLDDLYLTLPLVYLTQKDYTMEGLNRLINKLRGIAFIAYGNEEVDQQIKYSHYSFAIYPNGEVVEFKNKSNEDLFLKIITTIQTYTRKRVYAYPYSFNDIYSVVMKQMIEENILKEEEVTQEYQDKIKNMQVKTLELQTKIEKLEQNMTYLTSTIDYMQEIRDKRGHYPILVQGDIDEFYEYEQKDMVIHVLKENLEEMKPSVERQMLVDILLANPESGIRKEMHSIIEETCRQMRRSPSERDFNVLKRHGLDFKLEGKHYKASFYGDDRYIITIPSSSSDQYIGNVIYRTIRNFLF